MSSRLPTVFDDLFPDSSPEFLEIAETWPAHVVNQMLGLVWQAFDRLKALPNFSQLDFSKDYTQLERSLTDLHMLEITKLWGESSTSFETFVPQHESCEFESLKKRTARPPSCDLGFVLYSNRRIRWTVEGKVLATPDQISEYLGDLQKYLDGRMAPFSAQAALGAYLLSGKSEDLFAAIVKKLGVELKLHKDFPARPHRLSNHTRSAGAIGESISTDFVCHHLAFELN